MRLTHDFGHPRIVFILGAFPSITQAWPDMQRIFKSFAKLLNACQNLIHPAKQFPRPHIIGRLMFLDTARPDGKSDPFRSLGIRCLRIWVKDKLYRSVLISARHQPGVASTTSRFTARFADQTIVWAELTVQYRFTIPWSAEMEHQRDTPFQTN